MKRFVETNRWRDPWFRRLSPVAKLLWAFLTDNCDCVGLIDLDVESAAFHIGAPIDEKHFAELSDRIQRTIDGRVFIPRFITFQYGVLSESCPAHKPILRLISERELTLTGKGYQYPNDRVTLDMPMSAGKGKGKGKEGECEGKQEDLLLPKITAEDIYAAYPLKKERPHALAAIKTAMRQYPDSYLLERTKLYASTRNGNLEFVPYPAKWFKRGGFLDDPETWRPAPAATARESRQMSAFEIEKRLTAINQAIDRLWREDKVANRERIDGLKKDREKLKGELAKA